MIVRHQDPPRALNLTTIGSSQPLEFPTNFSGSDSLGMEWQHPPSWLHQHQSSARSTHRPLKLLPHENPLKSLAWSLLHHIPPFTPDHTPTKPQKRQESTSQSLDNKPAQPKLSQPCGHTYLDFFIPLFNRMNVSQRSSDTSILPSTILNSQCTSYGSNFLTKHLGAFAASPRVTNVLKGNIPRACNRVIKGQRERFSKVHKWEEYFVIGGGRSQ